VHSRNEFEIVEDDLRSTFEDLKVDLAFHQTSSRGWIGVSVSGEDEKVAMRYLEENVGFCPSSIDDVHDFSMFKGYVVNSSRRDDGLMLDVGVSSPRVLDAVIPLQTLQAQLADGRKVAVLKLAQLFGLCENLPLQVRVSRVDLESGHFDVELTERQVKQYADWSHSLLDRLIVTRASRGEAEAAVNMASLFRDVVKIDSLGFFEHALACKLGTDAAGLIPKIGRVLRRSGLTVFSGQKVVDFLGEDVFSSIFL